MILAVLLELGLREERVSTTVCCFSGSQYCGGGGHHGRCASECWYAVFADDDKPGNGLRRLSVPVHFLRWKEFTIQQSES